MSPDIEPVGVIEKFATTETVELPDSTGAVPLSADPAALLDKVEADIVIDFTNAAWTPAVARAALERGVRLVIGTTGLSDDLLRELDAACRERKLGAIVAPNFAIGAVLLIEMAKLASRFFDYAEITEMPPGEEGRRAFRDGGGNGAGDGGRARPVFRAHAAGEGAVDQRAWRRLRRYRDP